MCLNSRIVSDSINPDDTKASPISDAHEKRKEVFSQRRFVRSRAAKERSFVERADRNSDIAISPPELRHGSLKLEAF